MDSQGSVPTARDPGVTLSPQTGPMAPQLLPWLRYGCPRPGVMSHGGSGGGVAVTTSCSQSGDPLPWQCGAQGGKGGAGVMATAARHGDAGGGMGGDSGGDKAPALPVLLHSTLGHTGTHSPAPQRSPVPTPPSCPTQPVLGEVRGDTAHSDGPWALSTCPGSPGAPGPGWDEVQDRVPELSTVAQGRRSQSRTKTGRAWGFWGLDPGPCCLTRHVSPIPSAALGTLNPPATCPSL